MRTFVNSTEQLHRWNYLAEKKMPVLGRLVSTPVARKRKEVFLSMWPQGPFCNMAMPGQHTHHQPILDCAALTASPCQAELMQDRDVQHSTRGILWLWLAVRSTGVRPHIDQELYLQLLPHKPARTGEWKCTASFKYRRYRSHFLHMWFIYVQ